MLICAEVSDQNFIDEDIDGGKTEGQHNNLKRLKTLSSDSSYTDQVRFKLIVINIIFF